MDMVLAVLGGIAFVLLGAGFGYQSAMMRERKAGGGRTASELKTELEDYQQNVSDHFMESAALLQGMTEQYKKIYEHMARGAQELCETQEDRPELAALRNGLLAAALASSSHEDLVHVGKVLEAQAESRALEDEEHAALGAPQDEATGEVEAAAASPDAVSAEALEAAETEVDAEAPNAAPVEAVASEDEHAAAVEADETESAGVGDAEVAQAEFADTAVDGESETVAADDAEVVQIAAESDSESDSDGAEATPDQTPTPGWAERYRSA